MFTNLTIILLLLFAFLPFSSPHLGVLVYYWFTLIGITDKWAGGVGIPFGKIYAAVALLSWLFSKDKKAVRFDGPMIILIIFYLWTVFTSFFAMFPNSAWENLAEFSKIALMVPLLVAVINTRPRLQSLIWILAMAIGFNTVSTGIAAAVSGGSATMGSIPGSIYGTENTLARGAILVVPLMMFLYVQSEKQWARYILLAAAGFSVLCLIGTGSRGGLIGFAAMMAWVWLKSRKKIMLVALGLVAGGVLLATLSEKRLESWTGRMETIQEASDDKTSNQRFDAWVWTIQFVNQRPILGGGFGAFRAHVVEMSEDRTKSLLAHSNYFQVLGEHGYVGLVLYLALCIASFRAASKIFRIARDRPDMRYERDMAFMIQTMLVGYFVGGATITHTYYELFYVLIGITRVLRAQVDEKLAVQATKSPGKLDLDHLPSNHHARQPGGVQRNRSPTESRPPRIVK